MEQEICYENYPLSTVLTAALLEFSIYTLGSLIIYRTGIIWMLIYLACIAFLEVKLLGTGCVNCYYYGKVCFSGKGKLSARLFKKGSPEKFSNKLSDIWDILPDFLVSLVPVITGTVLMIMKFDWLLLIYVSALLLLSFIGTGFVRGQLACKYCKQRELGCPAEKIFQSKPDK